MKQALARPEQSDDAHATRISMGSRSAPNGTRIFGVQTINRRPECRSTSSARQGRVDLAMRSEMKAKAMLIGTALLGGQSLESQCDETSQEAALSSERGRRGRAHPEQLVHDPAVNDSCRLRTTGAPTDSPESACIEGRNAGSSGESNEEAYRAALESLGRLSNCSAQSTPLNTCIARADSPVVRRLWKRSQSWRGGSLT